ncbi:hypothetical protein AB4Z29_00385 [Paenibacillus sp. 2TAB23]|uniref:hypothetical protein n=1 Tax=Paenibacillus sp. 2TAB23 TaxID=3233004 RepID=UPI003F960206
MTIPVPGHEIVLKPVKKPFNRGAGPSGECHINLSNTRTITLPPHSVFRCEFDIKGHRQNAIIIYEWQGKESVDPVVLRGNYYFRNDYYDIRNTSNSPQEYLITGWYKNPPLAGQALWEISGCKDLEVSEFFFKIGFEDYNETNEEHDFNEAIVTIKKIDN